MTPEQIQKLTKMERMQLVVEYAKSVGFGGAMAIYWGERGYGGYGEYSPFEQADPNELKQFDIGLTLETEVTALWLIHEANESDDGERLVFDTKEEAEAFLRQQGGAA